jgi:hypothetical protein
MVVWIAEDQEAMMLQLLERIIFSNDLLPYIWGFLGLRGPLS